MGMMEVRKNGLNKALNSDILNYTKERCYYYTTSTSSTSCYYVVATLFHSLVGQKMVGSIYSCPPSSLPVVVVVAVE